MIRSNNLDREILWQDGMLLSAAHLSHLSTRLADIAFHHGASAVPFPWGVRSFEIDMDALAGGVFSLNAVDAILPNGAFLQLSLDQLPVVMELPEGPGETWVCVGPTPPAESAIENFIDLPSSDGGTDQDTPLVTLFKSAPRLSIVEKGQTLGNRIMLARVKCTNEQFSLIDYFPPAVSTFVGGPQWTYVDALLSDVRKALVVTAKNHRHSKPSNRIGKLERQFALQALSASLLTAEAELKAQGHPYHVYLQLCGLLGHADHLRDHGAPPSLTPFNHGNSRKSFFEVAVHIREALIGLTGGTYRIHRFEGTEDSFRLAMRAEWLAQPLILAVASENQTRQLEVTQWMMDCLIAPASKLRDLKRTRTVGGQRKLISDPPSRILQPDRIYFSVEVEDLAAGDELVLTNAGDHAPAPETIELVVRREVEGR